MLKTEEQISKWVKTTLPFKDFKKFKKLAVDKDTSIAELLRRVVLNFLKELE